MLEAGRITQSGTPDDIRRRPATAYVAALAGQNLLRGRADRGVLALDDHDLELRSADAHTIGPVLITIHPRAIALHDVEPHGSPRNTWRTSVAEIEPLGEVTRITLGTPLPLSVDVTPSAISSLGLAPGSSVWASVKATEVHLDPT
ncbi:MAG: TOBE domain-containing protein [Actinomycetota bacterium]